MELAEITGAELPQPTLPKALSKDGLQDRVMIWRARRQNPDMSIRQLAERLDMPETSVRRACKLIEVAPKEWLQACEYEAVKAWRHAIPKAARKGDHRPAKDLLLHTRAIEPVSTEQTHTVNVLIAQLSMPGLASASRQQRDVIDVIPSNNAAALPGVNDV